MKDCPKLLDLIPDQRRPRSSEERKLELRLAPPGDQWLPSFSSSKPTIPQKRASPGPVIGWPPIRSFRKNIANRCHSKSPAHDIGSSDKKKKDTVEPPARGVFRKINMDGIPIGRKVDLGAYDTYEKLAAAVDELFGALLASQMDSSEQKEIEAKGLLDGSGDYTLVYEDNEGDRMLVGDVPWPMFVATVKRLRVLKSSEVSAMSTCDLGNKMALRGEYH